MHWINFPLLLIMIYSGLRIYWAEDVYALGILGWEWFAFFPDGFYQTLDIERRLARGLAFHFNFAWLPKASRSRSAAFPAPRSAASRNSPTRISPSAGPSGPPTSSSSTATSSSSGATAT